MLQSDAKLSATTRLFWLILIDSSSRLVPAAAASFTNITIWTRISEQKEQIRIVRVREWLSFYFDNTLITFLYILFGNSYAVCTGHNVRKCLNFNVFFSSGSEHLSVFVCLAALSPKRYFYLTLLKFPALQLFSLPVSFTVLSSSHNNEDEIRGARISLNGSLHLLTALIQACMRTQFSTLELRII